MRRPMGLTRSNSVMQQFGNMFFHEGHEVDHLPDSQHAIVETASVAAHRGSSRLEGGLH